MPKPKIGHVFEIFRGFDIKARADFQIFRKWVFDDGEKEFFKFIPSQNWGIFLECVSLCKNLDLLFIRTPVIY